MVRGGESDQRPGPGSLLRPPGLCEAQESAGLDGGNRHGQNDLLVAEGIARRAAAQGLKAIARTAASGRWRFSEGARAQSECEQTRPRIVRARSGTIVMPERYIFGPDRTHLITAA